MVFSAIFNNISVISIKKPLKFKWKTYIQDLKNDKFIYMYMCFKYFNFEGRKKDYSFICKLFM